MSYSSTGNKPFEHASRTSHSYVINDDEVKSFLNQCELSKLKEEIEYNYENELIEIQEQHDEISHIVAIDGGYQEITVRKNYPSALLAFFQFGALFFDLKHLDCLASKPFIFPEDMAKFKELERIKLVLPTKHIPYKKNNSLTYSVRLALYDFFMEVRDGRRYMDSLYWFIFEEYFQPIANYKLGSNPNGNSSIILEKDKMNPSTFTFKDETGENIFLTDVFRLHEAIDDELGAGGILGYVATLVEQVILIHNMKFLLDKQPTLLKSIMFIKDGPLAFFGQTANMHKPMRKLCNYLIENHDLFLVGIEKSGVFVEHAQEICSEINGYSRIKPGQAFLLNNDYIYKYILPGDAQKTTYGNTSYYGGKIIYKANNESVYVVTLPVKNSDIIKKPQRSDFKNLDTVLSTLEKLKCAMYENSLVPIALANQLVSLANHPSAVLLEKFAKSNIK